ncbi:uncharacterized protein [Littorina saxatilis]|uniref:uncharacterized protein n=1 Tax=Littorina saxatilis TaxID=31220 RepID=UPI0038B5A4AC
MKLGCKMHVSLFFICALLVAFCGERGLAADKEDEKNNAKRNRSPNLTDETYTTLIAILKRPVSDRARTKQDGLLYRKVKRYNIRCERVADPYRGEHIERLTRDGLILLPPGEIDDCISFYRVLSLGDGSDKLWDMIRTKYFGISKLRILEHLRRSETQFKINPVFSNKAPLRPVVATRVMERHQFKINPVFSNKAPLRPVVATRVMERHQIDLVSFESLGLQQRGKGCYVLSILDCFSRFLWMRSIPDRRADTVAKKVEEIYLEFGPPAILQSDQESEFRGEVLKLCKEWNINIIRSRPHHPELQGKIERSHKTWKNKVRSLVQGLLTQTSISGKNCTEALPHIAKAYNIARHQSIQMSPYECLFGVKSNFIARAYAGGLYEDIEEDHNVHEVTHKNISLEINECEHAKRKRDVSDIRCFASETDTKQQKRMVERHQKKHCPNNYEIGEIVLVRCDGRDKRVQRGGLSLAKPRVHQALVRDRQHHMYIVMLISGVRKGEIIKVSVDKITSLTAKEELEKREKRFAPETSREKNKFVLNHLRSLERVELVTRSERTGIELLLDNAQLHGLELDSDNSGNGNCMFLALQQQLEKNGVKKNHREIRTEIVKFLSQNPILGEGRDTVYLPDFVSNYVSWEAYLNSLNEDGVWGDNIALLAAANVYQISICVVSSVHNSEPFIIEASSGISLFDVHLGHISEMHYVTLRPRHILCELCGHLDGDNICNHDCPPNTIIQNQQTCPYNGPSSPVEANEVHANINVEQLCSAVRKRKVNKYITELKRYLARHHV